LPSFVAVPVVGAEPVSPAAGSIARPALPVRADAPASTAERLLRDAPEVEALIVVDRPDGDPAGVGTAGTLSRAQVAGEGRLASPFRKVRHLEAGRALVIDADTPLLTAAQLLAEAGSPVPDVAVRGEQWGWIPAAALLDHVVQSFRDAAACDAVSGVMNRDSLDLTLEAWCNAISHTPHRLVAVVARAEGLEVVNEIAGRAAGDVVVAKVVAQIVAAAPAGAFVGRVGGGEVVVLGVLPDTPPHRVGAEVEAVRQAITTAANTPTKLPAHLSRVRWPTVRSGASVSARGSADPERVVNDARLSLRELAAAPTAPSRRPGAAAGLRRTTDERRGPRARSHKFLTGIAAPAAAGKGEGTDPAAGGDATVGETRATGASAAGAAGSRFQGVTGTDRRP
jgi:GGDEF domain-containing protein